ncbi:MAG TPA: hypothetical protein VH986_04870 [Acidimicrobiia bacterium]|jgi:hypothetical protein
MPVVRIEHPVADFARWKEAFDSDPVGREQIGVRRYTILRDLQGADVPDGGAYVLVDLELDTMEQAQRLRTALDELWGRVRPTGLIGDQVSRIAEVVETRDY